MGRFSIRGRAAAALVTPLALALSLGIATGAEAAKRPDGPRCTITGTSGDDVLRGTAGRDVLCGHGGDDKLYGRGGNDILVGGPGDDELHGGRGRDVLVDDSVNGLPVETSEGDVVTPRLLRSDDWGVTLEFNWKFPVGTRVQWRYSGGNCTRNEYSTPITIGANPKTDFILLFVARGGGVFDSCRYERSNARYYITFDIPDGRRREATFNAQQLSVAIKTIAFECEKRDVRCDGANGRVTFEDVG